MMPQNIDSALVRTLGDARGRQRSPFISVRVGNEWEVTTIFRSGESAPSFCEPFRRLWIAFEVDMMEKSLLDSKDPAPTTTTA